MNPYTYYPVLKLMVGIRKTKRVAIDIATVGLYAIIWISGLHHFSSLQFRARKENKKVYRTPVRMPYANDIF